MRKYVLCKMASIAIALLVLVLVPLPVIAAGETVSISDSICYGGTVTLPINIAGVTNLGAVTIWLSYNKGVVNVSSVADGDMGVVTYNIDNNNGVTKLVWFDAVGKTGDYIFVYVTLDAVGNLGDSSTLDLDVKDFADTFLNPIIPTVTDGTFTISTDSEGIIAGNLLTRAIVPVVCMAFIIMTMLKVGLREPKIIGLVLLTVAVYLGVSFISIIQEVINRLLVP